MCDEQAKGCSACRHCPERFMRESPVPRYDTDGALLLTHDERRIKNDDKFASSD